VLSAFSNISVAWHMASLEAPGGVITLCLGFAGIKLAGSAAYAYQLRYSTSSFIVCFAVFAVLDLSFLAYLPWGSLLLAFSHLLSLPWGLLLLTFSNSLALFSGLAVLISILEAASKALRQAQRHAA
jgi:hypothetical protein